jgi:predicted secreted protein
MKWTSIIAIYPLFWVMSAFFVMPFGLRTHDQAQAELIPGQVSSAPVNFRPGLIAKRTTVLAAVLFGLYYANYVNGWIGVEVLDYRYWLG